jgi:hypothetical protein
MTYTCSKDPSHQSDDPDYCSICGAKIAGNAASSLQAPPLSAAPIGGAPAGGSQNCPDCGTPRRSSAKFCEVCRYNFETGAAGAGAPPPVTAPPPSAPLPDPYPAAALPLSAPVLTSPPPIEAPVNAFPGVPAPVAVAAPPADIAMPLPDAGSLVKWEVQVQVDPSLYIEPDPAVPCPVGEPERLFPIDFAENLLGRRSDRKDIHPEIPLEDPGVSRRHAKLLKQPDGSLFLLDVGSSNGTYLNDVEVKPGVRTPLQPNDQITLGCWTRLTLRRIQE